MLTDQELQRAVQSLVDDWHPTYPTPWPLLAWLDDLQTSLSGRVGLAGRFLKELLPAPEWWDWFFQMAMHVGYQKWGAASCKEWLEHVHAEIVRVPLTTQQFMYDADVRKLGMMTRYWFPDWKPPENPPAPFPSRGIIYPKPGTAPVKDVFR